MPRPYGGIVEFLALTGQRREEVAQLKREELDEKARTWTIPSSRTKNKKAHIVHLSEPAWRVVAGAVCETARGDRTRPRNQDRIRNAPFTSELCACNHISDSCQ
jgi:integrase